MLQHRGQENAGIIVFENNIPKVKKGHGLVTEIFNNKDITDLKGNVGVGHVRYSTSGGKINIENAQPFLFKTKYGLIAIAHNGDLVKSYKLKQQFIKKGIVFHTTSDTEIIAHTFSRAEGKSLIERVTESLAPFRDGAYSVIMVIENKLVVARDIHGFRPLVIGKKDSSFFASSETCALDVIGARYVRDVEPGEIIIIDENGLNSYKPFKAINSRFCIFELTYFSRPDGVVYGIPAWEVHEMLGRKIAKKYKIKADIVVPIPDSANDAALGYSYESKIPFAHGFVRSHYTSRTFIDSTQELREQHTRRKLNPYSRVKNKDVILIDDSIVRGTVIKKAIKMLKGAGAKKIHVVIPFYPWISKCIYGIDTPTNEELIAYKRSIDKIKSYIGADSLEYLTVSEVVSTINEVAKKYNKSLSFCVACGTGKYPVRP